MAGASALFLVSGVAWLLSQQLARISCADWGIYLEFALAGASFAWSLMLPIALCGLDPAERVDATTEAEAGADEPRSPLDRALGQLAGYRELTDQERRVLALSLEGKSAKEAAEALDIAQSTAGTYYRTRAYQKLGVSSLQELIGKVKQAVTGGLAYEAPAEKNLGAPSEPAESAATPAAHVAVGILRARIPNRMLECAKCVAFAVVIAANVGLLRLFSGGWLAGTVLGPIFLAAVAFGASAAKP